MILRLFYQFKIYFFVILLVFIYSNAYGDKLIKEENINSFSFPGTESAILYRHKDFECYEYSKYIVITMCRKYSVGEDIVIKFLDATQKGNVSDELFFIENQWAEYFLGIYRDFLFIDSGTGPDGRKLFIYNLSKKMKIFESECVNPIIVDDKGMLSFWRTSGIVATKKNCENFEKWKDMGFGVVIEERVLLNLNNLKLSKTNETRCSPRQ